MLNPIIGIEIGTKNIKIIYGYNFRRTFRVKMCAVIELPDGAISDGNIINGDMIIDKISKFLLENKIKSKKVMLNIQSTSIITREIVVPKVGKKELEGLIELQKQDHFPIDISDYQVNYKINRTIKDKEGKESYEIMLVAVSKPFADKYIQLFDAMKLDVTIMDITANSLAKFFKTESFYGKEEEKKSIAVIDIGDKTTNVIITAGGNILFSRAVLYGLSELNAILDNEFPDRNEKDIEVFKKKYTALYVGDNIREDDVYGSNISNTIKPIIENNLISEINRFIGFYNSKFRKIPITQIYIVGGGAYIKNIDKYMKSVFKTEVILERDIGLITQDHRKAVLTDSNIFYFIGLIGLVNEHAKRTINLLPKWYNKVIEDKKNRHYIMLASAVAVVLIFLIGMVPDIWLAQKNELLASINTRIEDPKFNEVVVVRKEINDTQQQLDSQKNILNSIGNQSAIGSDLLQTILGALPSSIHIKTVTIDDATKHISIAGIVSAKDEFKVLEYTVNLQMIQGFKNVNFEVPFENKSEDSLNAQLTYTIDFDLATDGR